MELGQQVGREALTGGDQGADRGIMARVGDGEDEEVVTDAVDQ